MLYWIPLCLIDETWVYAILHFCGFFWQHFNRKYSVSCSSVLDITTLLFFHFLSNFAINHLYYFFIIIFLFWPSSFVPIEVIILKATIVYFRVSNSTAFPDILMRWLINLILCSCFHFVTITGYEVIWRKQMFLSGWINSKHHLVSNFIPTENINSFGVRTYSLTFVQIHFTHILSVFLSLSSHT